MGAGENNFIGIGIGGGGGVAPQTSSEPWPTTFTSTSGGGSTWTWTAPDGTDQSAHLTGGDGDLNDYPVPGVHVIEEQDGGGNTTALHTITLGTEGWLVLGDGGKSLLDMALSADPNSQLVSRAASSIVLNKTKPATVTGNDYFRLSLPLAIPAKKRARCRITRTSDTGSMGIVGCGLCKDPADLTDTVQFAALQENFGATPRAGRMTLGAGVNFANTAAGCTTGEGAMTAGNNGTTINWFVTQFNPSTGAPSAFYTDINVAYDQTQVAYATVIGIRESTQGADTTIGIKAEIQFY
jgi:hypothetical protein